MRVLLVEDDVLLGEGLLAGLREAAFEVDWVQDGQQALHALLSEAFSAAILDIGLPRLDGLSVLRQLRARGNRLPVLLLTARDAPADIIAGLDAGSDDYLVKPCDLGELAARLRALIRRAAGNAAPTMHLGALQIDPAARSVHWHGQRVDLAPREFKLLYELTLAAGRVMTKAQLESRLYPWGEEVESNAIEVHVHHLRRKLAPTLIRTVRGVGYLLEQTE